MSSSVSQIRIPGKLFLMGEYSVIEGGSAILAAVQPGYGYEKSSEKSVLVDHSVAGSPLSKYFKANACSFQIALTHPGLGAGFGSSTAEVIAAAVFNSHSSFAGLLEWYQAQFPETSGADLAVQIAAMKENHPLFEIANRGQGNAIAVHPLLSQIYLFQTPAAQKLPTHLDLKKNRPALDLVRSNTMVARLKQSLVSGDASGLVVLTEWAEYLSSLSLETDFAKKVRREFSSLPGIIGVKGCGAGLNDVFLVAAGKNNSPLELNTIARDFNLKTLGNLAALLWNDSGTIAKDSAQAASAGKKNGAFS